MANDSHEINSMDGNNVYIFTNIYDETTAGLIKSLSKWVKTKSMPKPIEEKPSTKNSKDLQKQFPDKHICHKPSKPEIIHQSGKIIMPYEKWPEDKPLLDIYVNSSGGSVYTLMAILTLIHMAKANGTIVRTTNLAWAASAASIITISGTKGYRYMAEDALNYIHFGRAGVIAERQDEIEYKIKSIKEHGKLLQKQYLENTGVTQKELDQYFEIEASGQLNSQECLKKRICDWVITNDGKYISR